MASCAGLDNPRTFVQEVFQRLSAAESREASQSDDLVLRRIHVPFFNLGVLLTIIKALGLLSLHCHAVTSEAEAGLSKARDVFHGVLVAVFGLCIKLSFICFVAVLVLNWGGVDGQGTSTLAVALSGKPSEHVLVERAVRPNCNACREV